MLEIEFEEPQSTVCDCCGKPATWLTRFVIKNGQAFAIYKVAFSAGHPEQGIIGLMSFGEWWVEGYVPESRVAIAFEIWSGEDQYNVGIADATDSPWTRSKLFGRMLGREEALDSEWIEDMFHITDHAISEDPAIREFFETVH